MAAATSKKLGPQNELGNIFHKTLKPADYPHRYLAMAVRCSSQADGLFGPTVYGCRDDFDFTVFFEDTFFAIIPSLLLLLAAPFQLVNLSCQRPILLPGRLLPLKLALSIAWFAIQIASLVDMALMPERSLAVSATAAAFSVMDGVTIPALSFYSHTRSAAPSTLLQSYLGASILLEIPRVRTSWLIPGHNSSSIIATLSLGLKASLFGAEAMGKRGLLRSGIAFPSPEAMIGLVNRSAFWWLNDILLTGMKRSIQINDMYELDDELLAHATHNRLREKLKASKLGALIRANQITFRSIDQSCLETTITKYRLLLSTMSAYRWSLGRAALPRVLLVGFRNCQPFLINALISLLSEKRTNLIKRKGHGLIAAYVLVYMGIAVSSALAH